MTRVESALAEVRQDLLAACRGEARTVRLAAPDVSLAVHSHSVRVVETLAEAFAPYLTPVDDAVGPRSDVSDEAYVHIDAKLALKITTVADSLSLEPRSEHGLVSRWHLVRKQVSAGAQRHLGHALWHQDAPKTTHVFAGNSEEADLTLLQRMVRAIAARRLLESGWVPLHAACVATGRGAVCLTGRRGRGKTTTALASLEAGAKFMANDRVFVAAQPRGGFIVRALPFSVGIRPPTTPLFPALARLTEEAPDLHRDNDVNAPTQSGADQRIALQPRRLAQTFNTSLVPTAPLQAVIQIDHRERQKTSRHRTQGPSRARASLREAYLAEWLPDDEYELARLDAEPAWLRTLHDELLGNVAQRVPTALFEPGHPQSQEFRRALADILDL